MPVVAFERNVGVIFGVAGYQSDQIAVPQYNISQDSGSHDTDVALIAAAFTGRCHVAASVDD